MSFFNFLNFFRNSSENRQNEQLDPVKNASLPGTQLFFDENLINNLQADHQDLLTLYGEMDKALSMNDYDHLISLFPQFSSKLRSHILTENLKLYVYLSHAMVNDAESLVIIPELRLEMQKIGRAVNSFLTRYSELPWTKEKQQSFPVEFKQTGEILVSRIKREEQSLYPLYMHPEAYFNTSENLE
jgi:hypothetical protein